MRKLLLGMIIGGAAVYFLDPENGGERRARLSGMWRERKDTVLEAARTTASTVTSVRQEVGGKVSDLRAKVDSKPEKAENGKVAVGAPETVFRKVEPGA